MKKKIRPIIIDANVPYMAGRSISSLNDNEIECAKKCVEFVNKISNNLGEYRVVVDNAWRIMKEYKSASKDTEPSLASCFYRKMCIYISTNIRNDDYVNLNETSSCVFCPYPQIETLLNFDPADRKYIAVAYKHKENPIIYEGTDSKWYGIQSDMKRIGINVNFICKEYIKEIFDKKFRL